MGDILHALPAVTALRNAHPGWVIDWVVEPRWQGLLATQSVSQLAQMSALQYQQQEASALGTFVSNFAVLQSARPMSAGCTLHVSSANEN